MIKNQCGRTLMIAGAVLFIISDSILAINKFYQSFEYAGIAIMLTYGIAQLLITFGASAIHYFNIKTINLLNRIVCRNMKSATAEGR